MSCLDRAVAALLALAAGAFLAAPATAGPSEDSTATVAEGARVRIFTSATPLAVIGRLANADSATIRLEPGAGQPSVEILREAVTRFEVSRGKTNRPRQGALLGWSLGLVSGALIGFATQDRASPCSSGDCGVFGNGGSSPLILGVAGAGTGLVVGLLIGSSIRRERWTPARIPGALGP